MNVHNCIRCNNPINYDDTDWCDVCDMSVFDERMVKQTKMLTIENINKIVNHSITNEWQIRSMHEVTQSDYVNGGYVYKELYEIIIQNKTTNDNFPIYLDRNYANDSIKHWYELSTTKGGKRRVQLITKETIKDIKELLEHIKIVAID